MASYLEDVAFQKYILSCLFPGAQVTTCLCLVDQSKTSNVETTFENFHISPRSLDLEGGTFQKQEFRLRVMWLRCEAAICANL